MALDKRVIAIQMLPKAYTEIQRLKGKLTWTQFIIKCVMSKVGDNTILQEELAGLIAEAKARKDKAEKPRAEKPEKVEKPKAEKPKKAVKAEIAKEPTEAELKAIETEQPTKNRESTAGISSPAMRQHSKGKTLQELQAAKK